MQALLRGLVWPSVILFGFGLVQGCRSGSTAGDEQPTAIPRDTKNYQLKGIVVSSDATKGVVEVDSQAIPGLMGAMIMPYKLAQPGVASELHPGDHITARLRVADSGSVIDQIDVTAQAKPDYKPSKAYNVPTNGEAVPDFKFLNQGGKTISVDQFRGKALLVTFIYTRCPLPDYCIRMSISFDPAYDTPQVLHSYGTAYAGNTAFSHWDFAAPPPAELDAVEEFFDVGVSSGSNNTLTHSLSTAVITPEGKIFRWYPNNDWTPSAVVDDVKQAIAE
jgi:protein SCO1/2